MTSTTAPLDHWSHSALEVGAHIPELDQVAEVGAVRIEQDKGDAVADLRDEHAERIVSGQGATHPDPYARVRMASCLHSATGWDIFSEIPTDREYVSRLWAEDWNSLEDSIYDE